MGEAAEPGGRAGLENCKCPCSFLSPPPAAPSPSTAAADGRKLFLASASTFPGTLGAKARRATANTHKLLITWDE